MAGQTTSFPARYNPLQLQSDTRTWRDTNGDNIAQDAEIGASNNAAFGQAVTTIRPDPDINREYDLEYTASVQHQIRQGCRSRAAFTAAAPTTSAVTQNNGWKPSDYTIVNVVSPLDGRSSRCYNLNPALRANVDRTDYNSTDSDLRRRTYNGIQVGFNARLAGANFFGGWTMDRIIDTRCDAIESNQARYAGTAAISANNAPQPDFQWCDQSQLDMPFLHEIKLAGSYTLPWYGIQTNIAFQSYSGQPLFTRWNIIADHSVRGELHGAVPSGRTGRAEPDPGELRARPRAARSRRTCQPGRTSSIWASASCGDRPAIRSRPRRTSSTS